MLERSLGGVNRAVLELIANREKPGGERIVLGREDRRKENRPYSILDAEAGLGPCVQRQEDRVLREEGEEIR